LNHLECQQMTFPTNRTTRRSNKFFRNHSSLSSHDDEHPDLGCGTKHSLQYEIPHNIRQKVISASDAAALVRDSDTICVSGFLCQGMETQTETWHILNECSYVNYFRFWYVGAPEAVLKALGERYSDTSSPNKLTLLFGGGVGDGCHRGLNHLAKTKEAEDVPPMLRRTIGSMYGLLPKIGQLALSNVVEAWTLPLGECSVSMMIIAPAASSSAHNFCYKGRFLV
jgi:acyl CoA:acetate/3-ketoacid CoA transferase